MLADRRAGSVESWWARGTECGAWASGDCWRCGNISGSQDLCLRYSRRKDAPRVVCDAGAAREHCLPLYWSSRTYRRMRFTRGVRDDGVCWRALADSPLTHEGCLFFQFRRHLSAPACAPRRDLRAPIICAALMMLLLETSTSIHRQRKRLLSGDIIHTWSLLYD